MCIRDRLEAMVRYIQSFLGEDSIALEKIRRLQKYYFALNHLKDSEQNRQEFYKKSLNSEGEELKNLTSEIVLNSNSNIQLKEKYERGNFIFAYYRAQREFQVETYENIEKVELQNKYNIVENPGAKLTKYLVDLKATQAFTKDVKKAEKIDRWFKRFENILKTIFEDEHLELKFNDETFQFSIHESDRESFDFNTMSSGYAAVLDIINDLIMRMEKNADKSFRFLQPGIVLIDEIETHLHLEMQRNILGLLTTLFPNIQFIVTTHSPFILNSLKDVVIYDLENHMLVENGLADVPYNGIVEGYFNVDGMSKLLAGKFQKYKEIVSKEKLKDEDFAEVAKLEMFLDEIPDYLALDIASEYQRLKLEFANREDI